MENVAIFYCHLVYIHILLSFGIFYGHLVYFFPFWYVAPRKIWQPCCYIERKNTFQETQRKTKTMRRSQGPNPWRFRKWCIRLRGCFAFFLGEKRTKNLLSFFAQVQGDQTSFFNRPKCSPIPFLSKPMQNIYFGKSSPPNCVTLVFKKKTVQSKQSPEKRKFAQSGTDVMIFKYFRRKIQRKKWSFWLKTKLKYAEYWS
jgi:hypothetical protein